MQRNVLYMGEMRVCIANRYGLHGPGIESRCGRDFPEPFRLAQEITQPLIQWVPGLFPGGKAVTHLLWRRGYRKSRAIHLLPLWGFI